MQTDILDFTIKLLSKCIPVKVRKLKKSTLESLRTEGYSRFKSFMIGQASALVEPVSAVIGAILVMYIRSMLPFLLAFAAGAMIIVVARELLPESINGNKNLSTFGLIFGFVLMMVLDVALG